MMARVVRSADVKIINVGITFLTHHYSAEIIAFHLESFAESIKGIGMW